MSEELQKIPPAEPAIQAEPLNNGYDQTTEQILVRIDGVLKSNRLKEWIYIGLTIVLFLVGIACIIYALVEREFAWTIPSAFTTFFLKYPFNLIRQIMRENKALAIVPALITKLPPDKAARELQKLIQQLYKEN